MAFFGISLTIILLALIAYDVSFVCRFSRGSQADDICLFICLIPLSPLLPFVFYFTASRDTTLAKFLESHFCGFNITFDSHSISKDASKLRIFMEKKLSRHFGFIIEALIEAFPQAILQMVAIVYFQEANLIAIISILLSMLSVSTKAFVFSIATALNLKQLFFNWCCAVTDFFGVFFAVTWVFYTPASDHLASAFTMIRTIWFYKLIISEFVMIGCASIAIHIAAMYNFYEYDIKLKPKLSDRICLSIFVFFLITFLWACGIIASALVLEITNWTYLAGTFYLLGTVRFGESKKSSEFWFSMVGWVNSAQKHRVGSLYKGCTSYTKTQDRMMRICSINNCFLQEKYTYHGNSMYYMWGLSDDQLKNYLKEHRDKSQYLTVTMAGIREHTKNPKRAELIQNFWYNYYGYMWTNECEGEIEYYWTRYKNNHYNCEALKDLLRHGFISICGATLTFIMGPIYFVGRFVTLLFPGFIVLYLYFGHNVNVWNTEFVDLFQKVMITVYLALCVLLSILFYMNCCEQYLLAHFVPSSDSFTPINSKSISEELIKDITNHYYGIVVIPIRRAIVIDRFGQDLGPIILSYLPLTDHYENARHQVVAPKVVV
eukprot:1066028_1